MRLDFNILWVDDQPDSVESQKKRVGIFLRNEGFRMDCAHAKSVEEAEGYLHNDIFGDHIDLVLMDYDLGVAVKGDEGLEVVRSKFPYKDIIFYSSQAPDLVSLVTSRKLQGIFCSTRQNLPETVNGVFQALVRKVIDIDHSRGIVMGASSEIDNLVNDCLIAVFEHGDGVVKSQIITDIIDRLKKIRDRFSNGADKLEGIAELSELFEHHSIFTSADRLNLLRKHLKRYAEHGPIETLLKEYVTVTVEKRNILGHVTVVREGFSRKLFNKKKEMVTSDNMTELRHELLKCLEAVEGLLLDLGPKD